MNGWQRDPSGEEAAAVAFAKATGAEIRQVPDLMELAVYLPISDCIRMRPPQGFASHAEYCRVLFHELGHWTSHDTRLGRVVDWNDPEDAAQEELAADMAAFTLCRAFNLGWETRGVPRDLESYMHQLTNPEYMARVEQYKCRLTDPDCLNRAARDAVAIMHYLCDVTAGKFDAALLARVETFRTRLDPQGFRQAREHELNANFQVTIQLLRQEWFSARRRAVAIKAAIRQMERLAA